MHSIGKRERRREGGIKVTGLKENVQLAQKKNDDFLLHLINGFEGGFQREVQACFYGDIIFGVL